MNDVKAPIFKQVGRRVVNSNSRFDICFDALEAPDGSQIEDFLIVRPHVLAADGVAGILILPEVEGKVGLMRGHRHQFGEYVWQAPGGFVEAGEKTNITAIRELEEETGLTCPPERLVALGTMLPDAGLVQGRVALYLARHAVSIDDHSEENPEPGTSDLTWFSQTEFHRLLLSEGNIGGSTLVAGFRYLNHVASLPKEGQA